jgi:hypothetical protein
MRRTPAAIVVVSKILPLSNGLQVPAADQLLRTLQGPLGGHGLDILGACLGVGPHGGGEDTVRDGRQCVW